MPGRRLAGGRLELVGVIGHLSRGQRYRFGPAGLADDEVGEAGALAGMDRDPPLQVGEGKVVDPVTSELGPQQGEQGSVLRDRHDLPVRERPAHGGEVEAEHPYFAKKRFTHRGSLMRVGSGTGC